MDVIFLIIAALAFSVGGLLMKLSATMTRPAQTAGFLVLFVAGAAVQTLGMRRTDLSVAYIFVLGLEAALTVLFSFWYLKENLPPQRIAAIVLIIVGIAWLRWT
ncbi:MAG TPA: SMR family transporter [Candidatus Acidoferrales bacterium]|nr:SMR family transporter [Candidatus Acidoferrales bacterium]